jgi:general secretion pathway protein A
VCQAALVYGFADEAATISQDIVRQAAEDKIGVGPGLNSGEDNDTAVETSNDVLQQLQKMEGEMQSLRQQVESQTKELQQTAAGNRNELVARLKKLLQAERRRNTNLIRRYSRLEMKYEALLRVKTRLQEELESVLEDKS